MGRTYKMAKWQFQNTLRPHVQICCGMSPHNYSLLPFGSSSRISPGLGGHPLLQLLSPHSLSVLDLPESPRCLQSAWPGGSKHTGLGLECSPPTPLPTWPTAGTLQVWIEYAFLRWLPWSWQGLVPLFWGLTRYLSFPAHHTEELCCALAQRL